MIWLEKKTNVLYQEEEPIVSLSPLERNLLLYFLQHPRVNLTKSEIIENSWPSDVRREGVSDDSLFRLIRALRLKLKQGPSDCRKYIINWRGYPEGGYRFLPDGLEHGTKESHQDENFGDTLEQLVALKRIISNQMKTILLLEAMLEEVTGKVQSERPIHDKTAVSQTETTVNHHHYPLINSDIS
ncbi:MAG: winged helix-turn-helix domain-containing protein [Chloroflexota bacterium]